MSGAHPAMHAELQATVAFHLTGQRADLALGAVDGAGMRPALLASYRDLTRLRYDYPLVLVRGAKDGTQLESLSRLVDRALEKAALAGQEGERLRAHALRLERELRAAVAGGAAGSMQELLEQAAKRLSTSADAALAGNLARLRKALAFDGEVLDCGKDTPARVLEHLWAAGQAQKADAFRHQVERLILKLGDILRADASHSDAARSAAGLAASVGAIHGEALDFEKMSRLLARVPAGGKLTESRRRRIEATLAELRAQRFYAMPGGAEPYAFRFDDCPSALAAFRKRIPEMASLARAITIARLEIDGEYNAPRHDAVFERLAASGLDLRDLALFPDYLVRIRARDLRAAEHGELLELLSSGLPVKILVQSDDLLEAPLVETGHLAFGARSRQFANMAIGLNDVYVVQASASHLLKLRDRIAKAMAYAGPALVSVFSGATGHGGGLPPYLTAAAAMESRAFPAFVYDPAAGDDWASRFSLADNPQPEADWPVHELVYEDSDRNRVADRTAFTLVDFIACDTRYASHFAKVPRAGWDSGMAPVSECLGPDTPGVPATLPALFMVGGDDRLEKAIVDGRLLREARRCREMWRSLQELGGIHNSHAARALERERQKLAEAAAKQAAAAPRTEAAAAPAAAPVPAQAAAAAPAEAEKAPPPDEPYIETPRCSSCDECVQLNPRMFAYDENKQARIVDAAAGTYRQLVEAAESCQVAVIHPGKPKNPNEPGLEELLKRAEAFL